MILIVNSLTMKSEEYRTVLRHFMRSRLSKKSKVELIFRQSTHFKNLLIECELTIQLLGGDLERVFAVGYSEEDVFADIILKFKALTENKARLFKLDGITHESYSIY